MPSPSTPRPGTSHSRNGDFGWSGGFGSTAESGNGLGSLADELAEAYSDEEGGEPEEGLSGDQIDGVGCFSNGYREQEDERRFGHGEAQHNGILAPSIPGSTSDTVTPKQSTSSKHRRKQSRYNHSIDSDDSDVEKTEGIPPSLEARIVAIETSAREGTATNDSEADTIIPRVAESLKDLGSQSGIESGTARYVAVHSYFSDQNNPHR